MNINRHRAKLALISLANRANEDGRDAWPSVETIARETMTSRKTVEKLLKALRVAGLIHEQAPPRQRRPRTYALDMDALIALNPSTPAARYSRTTDLDSPDRQSIGTELEPAGRYVNGTELTPEVAPGRQSQHPDRYFRDSRSVLSGSQIGTSEVPTNMNSTLEQCVNNTTHTDTRAFNRAKSIVREILAREGPGSIAKVLITEQCERAEIDPGLALEVYEYAARRRRS